MANTGGRPPDPELLLTFYCKPGLRPFLDVCAEHQEASVHQMDGNEVDGAWYSRLIRVFYGHDTVTISMLIGLIITPGFDQSKIKHVLDVVVACLKRIGLDPEYELPGDIVERMREHVAKLPHIPLLDDDLPVRKPLDQIACDEGLVPFLELCAEWRRLVVTTQDGDRVNGDSFRSLLLRHFNGSHGVTIDELMVLFVKKGFSPRQIDLVLLLMLERLKRLGLDPNYELPDRAGELLQEHLNPDENLEAAS